MAVLVRRPPILSIPKPSGGGVVTPTFVHATASDLNDNNGITGNNFVFNAPNASLGANAQILAVAYPYSATRTRSVADSTSASWGSPVATYGTASTGHMNLAFYLLPNVAAALHVLTFTFDAELKPFWYEVIEFYNVAPSSPFDGSAGQVVSAGGSIVAGAYAPNTNNDANGGHLIITVAISDDPVGTNVANQASAMSASGGAHLIHANNVCTIPQISSYQVQATNGSINPGFSITQSTPTDFIVGSIALKAGSAGSDMPAGPKVRKILHYSLVNPVAGNNLVLAPTVGNTVVATMAAGNNLNNVNGVTDTSSNTLAPRAAAGESQIFDKSNLTPSDSYGINLNLDAGEPQFSLHVFDLAEMSANSFDRAQGFNGSSPNATSFPDFPDFTPTAAPGVVIMQGGLGTSSQFSLAAGAPAGAVFDCVTYTSSAPFDGDRADNADPFAHVLYSTTALQTWNWNQLAASFGSTAFATACSYK